MAEGSPSSSPILPAARPILAGLNEQPVNIEAGLLREGAKGREHF